MCKPTVFAKTERPTRLLQRAEGSLLRMGTPSDDGYTNRRPQSNHQDLENGQPNGTEKRYSKISDGSPAKPIWILKISLICFVFIAGIFTGIRSGFYRQKGRNETQPNLVTTISPPAPDITSSPSQWKRNGKWEYLFSETETTWDESWKNCSSYNASLVTLDTVEEKEFIEGGKRLKDTWIDLRRKSPHETWRYSNGTAFDNRFKIVNEEGLCAYWSVYHISSTTCDRRRHYVCRKAAPKL